MNEINLSAVDLNLLVALEALLRERSVTRAAQRVGVTQSAMSHSLARLRRLFDDPLLVRAGRGMQPTPRAEALEAPLRRAMADLERLIQGGAGFDPATTRRRFVLICPDLLASFLPELLARLAGEAPGARLAIRPPGPEGAGALLAGGVDLALVGPTPDTPGLMRRSLGRTEWVVMGRRGHPALAGPLTPGAWVAWPHAIVAFGDAGRSIVGEAIRAAGLTRRIGLEAPGFLAVPPAIARTDLLFTAPRALVAPLVAPLALELRPPPIPIPPAPVSMVWPERLHADPGHRWLRGVIAEATGAVLRA